MLSLSGTNPPLDPAAALKVIDAARADPKHELWSMPDDQRDKLYHSAFPGPVPPLVGPAAPSAASPAAPVPSAPPPDSLAALERDTAALVARSPRQHAHLTEQESMALVARRRVLLGQANQPLFEVDDAGRVREPPDPTEIPPVSVEDADLPLITLPEGISADDPVVRAVRQLGILAEVPPAAVEGLVAHVHRLRETALPDEEEYWRQSDAVVEAARQKYGPRFDAFVDAMKRGRRFAEQHEPALADVLDDLMVQKDPMVAKILAHLGSKGRSLYVRKYGTKPVARVS